MAEDEFFQRIATVEEGVVPSTHERPQGTAALRARGQASRRVAEGTSATEVSTEATSEPDEPRATGHASGPARSALSRSVVLLSAALVLIGIGMFAASLLQKGAEPRVDDGLPYGPPEAPLAFQAHAEGRATRVQPPRSHRRPAIERARSRAARDPKRAEASSPAPATAPVPSQPAPSPPGQEAFGFERHRP